MSEDLAPAPARALAPDPRRGARSRLLQALRNASTLPGIPLPMKAMMGAVSGLAQVVVRSDEDALAVNSSMRVLSGLFHDYVDGLEPDFDAADRTMAELSRRFQDR